MELKDKHYLGDGVYVGHDGYQLWIWLEGSDRPCSEGIALEPPLLTKLNQYWVGIQEKYAPGAGDSE